MDRTVTELGCAVILLSTMDWRPDDGNSAVLKNLVTIRRMAWCLIGKFPLEDTMIRSGRLLFEC